MTLREIAEAWAAICAPEEHASLEKKMEAHTLLNALTVANLGSCAGAYVFECAVGHRETKMHTNPVVPPAIPCCYECGGHNVIDETGDKYWRAAPKMRIVSAPERR